MLKYSAPFFFKLGNHLYWFIEYKNQQFLNARKDQVWLHTQIVYVVSKVISLNLLFGANTDFKESSQDVRELP